MLDFLFKKRLKEIEKHEHSLESLSKKMTALVNDAEQAKLFALRQNITHLDRLNINSEEYRSALSDIWTSPEFQTELFLSRQIIHAKLVTENTDQAVKLQCMLKGIDILITNMQKAFVDRERTTINAGRDYSEDVETEIP